MMCRVRCDVDYLGILVIGVVLGFCIAVSGSNSSDKKAAESGYVKLDGEIYRLTKLEKEE
jgi:hypothetical protein